MQVRSLSQCRWKKRLSSIAELIFVFTVKVFFTFRHSGAKHYPLDKLIAFGSTYPVDSDLFAVQLCSSFPNLGPIDMKSVIPHAHFRK